MDEFCKTNEEACKDDPNDKLYKPPREEALQVKAKDTKKGSQKKKPKKPKKPKGRRVSFNLKMNQIRKI